MNKKLNKRWFGRYCKTCGVKVGKGKSYCSNDCRPSCKKPIIRKCKTCGVEVGKGKSYCSNDCRPSKRVPNNDKQNDNWLKKYDLLKNYMNKYGKPPAQIRPNRFPDRFVNGKWKTKEEEDLHSLSVWVMQQRAHFRKDELSKKRISFLREISFPFDAKEASFFRSYNQFLNYFESGISFGDKEYKKIFHWLKYKQNLGELPTYQKELVKEIQDKFDSLESGHEIKWKERYNFFKEFYYKNKKIPKTRHINSPIEIDDDEQKIGLWYRVQVNNYREGKLSEDRLGLMKAITPDFGERQRNERISWNQLFEYYVEFINKYNREPRQHKGSDIEKKLGQWVSHNKQKYHKTSRQELSSIQIQKLLSINFDFKFRHTKFNKDLNYLKFKADEYQNFYNSHGYYPKRNYNSVNQNDIDKKAYIINESFSKGILDEGYKEILLNNLKLIKNDELIKSEKVLWLWERNLKNKYRKGELSDNQIKILEKYDFFLERFKI